jgi:hypothetical protein
VDTKKMQSYDMRPRSSRVMMRRRKILHPKYSSDVLSNSMMTMGGYGRIARKVTMLSILNIYQTSSSSDKTK